MQLSLWFLWHLAAMGSVLAGNVGTVSVREVDWAVPSHRDGLGPFDYILAADCV